MDLPSYIVKLTISVYFISLVGKITNTT